MKTKIKGMKVTEYGMDLELIVSPHPKLALTASKQSGEKAWYTCPSLAYVIEHPEGLILWETSLSEKYLSEWLEPWQELVDLSNVSAENLLEAHLRRNGYAVEDFRYVIMGHLHCDHAGGLRLFEHAPAEIICHEDEYRFAMGLEADEQFYIRADWEFLSRKRPTMVTGDQEILKDLKLHSLPGHTVGSIGLSTKLDHCGWLFMTSDALNTHENYGPPAVGSPIMWDVGKYHASVEKLRRLATASDALVMPGHDTVGVQHSHDKVSFEEIKYLPDGFYE
jgi:N-acyl homoserine lactone hydrolase